MPPFIAPPDPFDDPFRVGPQLRLAPGRLGFMDDFEDDEQELVGPRPPQLLGALGLRADPERPRLNLGRRDVSGLLSERDRLQETGGSTRTEKIIAGLGLATSAIGALAGSPGLAGAGEIAATSAAIPGEQRRERRDTGIATLDEQIADFEEQNRRSQELEDRALFNQRDRDFTDEAERRRDALKLQETRRHAAGLLEAKQAEVERINTRELGEAAGVVGARNAEFDRRRGLSPTLIEQARIDASNRSNRDDPEKARKAAAVQAETDRKKRVTVDRLKSGLRRKVRRVQAAGLELAALRREREARAQSAGVAARPPSEEEIKLQSELDELTEEAFLLTRELKGLQGSGGDDGLDEQIQQLEEEISDLER